MINPRGIMSLVPMLRISVALIVGIIVGDVLGGYVMPLEWFCAAAVSCVIGICVLDKKVLSSFIVFLTIFYLGAWYISYKGTQIPEYSNHHRECEGVIISEPVQKGKVVQCDILLTKGWQEAPTKVRASIRRDSLDKDLKSFLRDTLMVGTTLKWTGTVQQPHEWSGHDDKHFSYVRWMRINGYDANVFLAKGQWKAADIDMSKLSLWQHVKLRFLIARSELIHKMSLQEIDDESFAVVAAMTMGEKTYLKKDQKDMFSVAGAAHILALSGMHIGIIMFLLTVIVGGRKKVRLQICAIITVWLFVIFIGMTVSAMRAALMMTMWYVLHVMRRSQHPLNVLGLVAFVLLVVNPEMIFDVGFQMSFMSVFFIFLCMPYLQEHRPFKPKKKKRLLGWREKIGQKVWIWVYSLLCISCVAQLGTLPLTMYYFGRIPVYFLLTNIIVLPLSVLIIYLTLVFVIMLLMGCFVNEVAWVLNTVIGVMMEAVKCIAALPGASVENVDINVLQVVMMYVVIFSGIALVKKMYKGVK